MKTSRFTESQLINILKKAAAIAPGKAGQPIKTQALRNDGGSRYHLIGGASFASELDAKRAIREGAELAAAL